MSIGEDIRGHAKLLASDALDRIAPIVYLRGDVLDDYADATIE
jgi:hypothetical protein